MLEIRIHPNEISDAFMSVLGTLIYFISMPFLGDLEDFKHHRSSETAICTWLIPDLFIPQQSTVYFNQCISELRRKLFRCFYRRFTLSNRSDTSRSHNHSICHFAYFFGLFWRTNSKSHTHGCEGVLTHARNQIAKSL